MTPTILVVEDDPAILEMVTHYLVKEQFRVVYATDGIEAIKKIQQQSFDLVLLDLMLPKLNGMDVLKQLRERSTTPVLILSAKDSDVDKALGLGFGADDYMTKPFSMIELVARIRAAIRRATKYSAATKEAPSTIQVHDITLHIHNFQAVKNGVELKLTSKEWAILKLFFSNPKRVFTKEQLYETIWQDDYYGAENVINVHMRRLREKIEDNPSNPKYIQTLWGIGYRLGEFQ